MSFAAGNSSIPHYSFRRTTESSSECCLQSPFTSCSLRIAPARSEKAKALAYLRRDDNSCSRRVVLVMGFAVIRLLKMRAHAVDFPSAESTELTAPDPNHHVEVSAQGRPSGNPFFSILNVLGILGSGVLAALFVSKKKEKAASDATLEYMKNTLKEKEAAVSLLEEKFEEELKNEKEFHNKELRKVKAEQISLVNQLEIAAGTVTNLTQELRTEQKIVEELNIQVDNLEHCFRNAGDEKRQLQQQLKEKLNCVGVFQERIDLLSMEIKDKEDTIWHLSSELSVKDRELNQLTSVYQQSEDHLTCLQSENRQLKNLLLKNREELGLKYESVNQLESELTTLLAEKDESDKKLDAITMEYNNFKSAMEKKSTLDSKLLGEREVKVHLLEEQVKILLDDKKRDDLLISALTQERDKLKESVNVELENMKILEEELRITQVTLEESRCETSNLSEQLLEARRLCLELEDEVSKVQAEFNEARQSLQRKLDEAKQGAEILAEEVTSTKDLLSKSGEELKNMSTDLAAAMLKCSIFEEDLIEAHKKAESASVDLSEEKKIIYSLNKELKDLETQISEDKEARKSLESELEEATIFLNEVNKNASTLSRELKLAHSQISSLEDEKVRLYKFINVQKEASQESQVNMEDAHNLVMRLGKERESLIKRGKKLEEELAFTKGEILRLMSQIKSSKPAVDVDEEDKAAEASRRNVQRRRKAKPQKQDY